MANSFWIGTAVNGKHERSSVSAFEELQAQLLAIPTDLTGRRIDQRLERTAKAYCISRLEPSSHAEMLYTMFDHIASAVAKDQFEVATGVKENFPLYPGWIASAASTVIESVRANDFSELIIRKSMFIKERPMTLRGFGRMALAELEPWGVYEPYAVAAGIASDQITLHREADSAII